MNMFDEVVVFPDERSFYDINNFCGGRKNPYPENRNPSPV
jgi:hypothetical protein